MVGLELQRGRDARSNMSVIPWRCILSLPFHRLSEFGQLRFNRRESSLHLVLCARRPAG